MNNDICQNSHRNDDRFTDLPIDQGGSGRHKCAGCAYELGFQDGTLRKEKIHIDLDSIPFSQAGVTKGVISCEEVRYDFRNTKISTGLFGVNRIFLPTSNIFPTLVASDTNDFITTKFITASNEAEYKSKFIEEIYKQKQFRKVTKQEACRIQGFPQDFKLPENRARWMKLLGNSVSVPVVEALARAICDTGVFDDKFEERQERDTSIPGI